MKTDTLTERTQGEYIAHNKNNENYIDIDCNGNRITSLFIGEGCEENKANAAFICKAVNNYDALLSTLKELLTLDLGDICTNELSNPFDEGIRQSEQLKAVIQQAKEAIKKAEQ